jgi:hypothetical protein
MCLRYFYSTYAATNVAPGSDVGLDAGGAPTFSLIPIFNQFSLTANTARILGIYLFPALMRVAPSVVYWDLKGTISTCTLLNAAGQIASHGNSETYQGITAFRDKYAFQTGTSNYGACCCAIFSAEL